MKGNNLQLTCQKCFSFLAKVLFTFKTASLYPAKVLPESLKGLHEPSKVLHLAFQSASSSLQKYLFTSQKCLPYHTKCFRNPSKVRFLRVKSPFINFKRISFSQ